MNRAQADILMKRATYASVSVAVTLVVVKAYVWFISSSAAMLGSAADSALDLAASVVTLLAIRTAITPPDDAHRFGHGKAEALAGLFQAAIMAGSAVFIVLHAIERIWAPAPVTASDQVIQVSILAIAMSLLLVIFQSYVIRKTGSLAVSGDHLHYKGDLLLNLGVVVAAYGAGVGYIYADGAIGLMIGLYILWGAYGISRPATDMLMDREFSNSERETIFNTVMESAGVLGLHDLKTRAAGRDKFIQMHIEVDGTLTVKAAHLIGDEVEATLGEQFPDAEILIHVDPVSDLSTELTQAELSIDTQHKKE
ncbi:cation diffusion facilitator family transporter [Kordiimonas aquimaris]|uniref:cation diffusion facilitator family transporter n=1 Tax=Kordiimonas aquimaris TaxID=707591 RepID=UPI0021CFF491|nr:cation diffusion facilitator family transporter [Kordiimonas aquimaris]